MREDLFLRQPCSSLNDDSNLPPDVLEEIEEAIGDVLSLESASECDDILEPMFDVAEGIETDSGTRQMQATFLEMARQALNPVERYMKAMASGEGANELLEVSELIVTPLIPKVQAVGLHEHAEDLSFFRSLLLLALGERDPSGAESMKEVVMEGFAQLSMRFGLRCRGYRLAVKNVVDFYRAMRNQDGISQEDTRRFFGIGVPSVTWVRRTRVSDLTSLSGIDGDVITQIKILAKMHHANNMTSSARLVREDIKSPRPLSRCQDVEVGANEDIFAEDVLDASVADILQDTHPVRGQA